MTVVDLDTRRRFTIGASEAASACNVDPFRSAVMLWAEKTGRYERPATEAMEIGTRLQPFIAELLGERGYEVMPAPADGFAHASEEWLVSHPDGLTPLAGTIGPVELKTRGTAWAKDDDTALFSYVMQVQHQMVTMDANAGLLAILHGGYGGLRLETREVERDDALIETMLHLEARFLQYVRTDTPPPPDGSRSATEAIRAIYPETARPTMRLSGAGWEALKELKARKEQRKEIERQEAELEQRIQLEMGGAWAAISPVDTNVAEWGMVDGHRFDTKRFRADHPEFDLDYYMPTRTRRFTLK